jgi:hypothetical protein
MNRLPVKTSFRVEYPTMRVHHVKPGFHIAGLALAVLGTTVRLMPFWPKAPELREAALIAVDALIAYGVVWAAGWGLAWCSDDGHS